MPYLKLIIIFLLFTFCWPLSISAADGATKENHEVSFLYVLNLNNVKISYDKLNTKILKLSGEIDDENSIGNFIADKFVNPHAFLIIMDDVCLECTLNN